MDYETAMRSTVSRDEVESEIEKHQCDFSEFLADCGDKPQYKGKIVLDWLGY